jgi:acetyl esterase/lipase
MAVAAAQAVVWVKNNIKPYGGDPDKIFVSGHSAGGHLAALLAIQNEYFYSLGLPNPIKGAILIDAAGLDMYGYLQEQKLAPGHTFLQTFTADPAVWKQASPLYHLHPHMPPLLIYRGENTYPSIIKSNEKFVKALASFIGTAPRYHVLQGKKHVPMITQFFFSWNPLYQEIINFMQTVQ